MWSKIWIHLTLFNVSCKFNFITKLIHNKLTKQSLHKYANTTEQNLVQGSLFCMNLISKRALPRAWFCCEHWHAWPKDNGTRQHRLLSYFISRCIFNKNFWWGTQNFRSPSGTDGDEAVGGGNLRTKSDWSQNCPLNAILGHVLLF